MLKALLRVRLRAMLAAFFTRRGGSGSRAGKKRSPVGYVVLLVYCLGAFGFLFYTSFSQLAVAYFPAGLGWLYFVMFSIMAFALMLLGSVFTAKAQLFEAKDNDLLLSMPVKPGRILLSRMAALLALDYLYEAVVAVPVLLAWLRYGEASAMGLVAFVLIVLALPLFSVAISCLFAWLLSLVTSRLRSTTLLTMVLSIALMLGYFLLCARMNRYIALVAENGQQLAHALGAFRPLYWLGQAAAEASVGSLLLTLLWLLAPFALAYVLLSRSFVRLVTTQRGHARVYRAKQPLRVRTPAHALFSRELARLLSSAGYMLNAGLGLIFELVLAVLLLVKRDTVRQLLSQLDAAELPLAPLALLAMFLVTSMVYLTSCSVSLEGKSYWLLRALPVETKRVLRAKLRLANVLSVPPALCLAAAAALALRLHVSQALLMAACQLLFSLLVSNVGLIEDLRHCNLHWTNEMQAVKQGLGTLFTMLLGWGFALALGAVYLLLLVRVMEPKVFLCALLGTLLAGVVVSLRWLDTHGCARFESLG